MKLKDMFGVTLATLLFLIALAALSHKLKQVNRATEALQKIQSYVSANQNLN